MKNILLFIYLFIPFCNYAQTILVPYKVGDKFGLADEKGKLIITPKYDELEYVKADYFEYTNKIIVKDTINNYGNIEIREDKKRYAGLIYKNKVLISDQEVSHFFIYPNLIIGSENEYRPERCILFNLKGKQLLKKVKALYVNDKRDFGNLTHLSEKYTLLTIFENGENRTKLFSLAVFDNQLQQITKTLLTKVTNYKLDEFHKGSNYIFCTYNNDKGYNEKCIRFVNNNFEVVDKAALKPNELKEMNNSQGGYFDDENLAVPIMEEPSDKNYKISTINTPETLTESEQEEKGYMYYQKRNDSLFYVKPTIKNYISTPKNMELIFVNNAKGYVQDESLIYKTNNKYGLIIKGIITNKLYDSLFYYGKGFVAYQTINNQKKCGVLNKAGTAIIPIIYDSIKTNTQEFKFDDDGNYNNRKYFFTVKDKTDYYTDANKFSHIKSSISNFIFVYKNGKVGVLDKNNNIIIPIIYDLIAQNTYSYNEPKSNNFFLLKNNNLYGVTTLAYNYKTKLYEAVQTVSPIFTKIPVFVINDYNGKSGFKLYGLYDESYKFVGYANANGTHFFKK